MQAVLSHSKRFVIACYAFLTLQTALVGNMALRWSNIWVENRTKLLLLTTVNAGITTSTEFLSRAVASPFNDDPTHYEFFIKDRSGLASINRQSLTNIFMTIIASLLGGPVFFILSRTNRFIYFVLFGFINSMLSQTLVGVLQSASTLIYGKRLIFDLIYNGTFKFYFFEFFRRPLIQAHHNFSKITFFRSTQDLLTTFFKVTLLNIFGFRG